MSFATTKMTRGSRNPPIGEHTAPSRRGGIIDYRNGFSVPMPRANAFVASAPTRPTKIDIRLENETRAAPARVLSVSYTPAAAPPAPAAPLDMKHLAHQVANEYVCERDKALAPAAAPAEVSEMEGLRAHLQSVATNQRDMYAQLSAMSQSAQADRTGLSERMTNVESLRAVVQQQSKSLHTLSQSLAKDGPGDSGLSSQVLRHVSHKDIHDSDDKKSKVLSLYIYRKKYIYRERGIYIYMYVCIYTYIVALWRQARPISRLKKSNVLSRHIHRKRHI